MSEPTIDETVRAIERLRAANLDEQAQAAEALSAWRESMTQPASSVTVDNCDISGAEDGNDGDVPEEA